MTELTYSCVGECRIPNLAVPKEPPVSARLVCGKYALLRRKYLKHNRRILFVNLLTSGHLYEHLTEIEQTAIGRIEQLTIQMAAKQGVTEQMKAWNQMLWVGMMNNIKSCAEEIVLKEIVYA